MVETAMNTMQRFTEVLSNIILCLILLETYECTNKKYIF